MGFLLISWAFCSSLSSALEALNTSEELLGAPGKAPKTPGNAIYRRFKGGFLTILAPEIQPGASISELLGEAPSGSWLGAPGSCWELRNGQKCPFPAPSLVLGGIFWPFLAPPSSFLAASPSSEELLGAARFWAKMAPSSHLGAGKGGFFGHFWPPKTGRQSLSRALAASFEQLGAMSF